MKLPWSTPFSMKTSMPAEVVARRLREAIARPWTLASRTEFPVAGWETNGVWTLYVRPTPFSRNHVRRVLQFELTSDGKGALLQGAFRPSRATVGFAVFLASFSLMGVVMSFTDTVRERGVSSFWHDASAYQPLLFVVFAAVLIVGGLMWASASEWRLAEFLQDLLVGPLAERNAREGGGLVIRPRRFRD